MKTIDKLEFREYDVSCRMVRDEEVVFMKRCIRGLCGVIAVANVLVCIPVMAAGYDADLPEVVQDDDSDEEFSIAITDITAEMAANYALNHALKFGHDDFTAGIAVKYFSSDGQMLGWMVPYVCNGQPSGYVLLDFTQEDPVSEFMFGNDSMIINENHVVESTSDSYVLIEDGIWNYNYVLESDIISSYSSVENGYYVFDNWDDYYNNFFKVGPGSGDNVYRTAILMTTYSNEVHIGRREIVDDFDGRYACGCVAALNMIKQSGIFNEDESDFDIYRWFWRETKAVPTDDWNLNESFDDLYVRLENEYGKDVVATSYVDESDNIRRRAIQGTVSNEAFMSAIEKWCKEHGKPTVAHVSGSDIMKERIEGGIGSNCPTFMSYTVEFKDGRQTKHMVNVVGYCFYKNPDSGISSNKMKYAIIADGYHGDGYRYVNYSHTKWSPVLAGSITYTYVGYFRNMI